jgi:hypothetical protein
VNPTNFTNIMNRSDPNPPKPSLIIPIVVAICASQGITSEMAGQPWWLRVIVAGAAAGALTALVQWIMVRVANR